MVEMYLDGELIAIGEPLFEKEHPTIHGHDVTSEEFPILVSETYKDGWA